MTRLAFHFGAMALRSQLEVELSHETIWNSDKFAADERPEWVKGILRGGHNVTAFLENGRWYFEPTVPKEQLPVGHTVNLYKKTGEKIPSIWTGLKFIDLRSDEGKALYDATRSVRAA